MPDKRLTESPESRSRDQEDVSSTRYPSCSRNRAAPRRTVHKGLAMITAFPTFSPAHSPKSPVFAYYEEYFDGMEIFWRRPGRPSRLFFPALDAPVEHFLVLDLRPEAPLDLDPQNAGPPVDEDHGAAGGSHQFRGVVDDELEQDRRVALLVQRSADLEDRRELLLLPLQPSH